MRSNRVKRAIDVGLTSLTVTDADVRRIVAHATGGTKVKRKISLALVLAIVLATLAATALAVITVRELGQVIARNEKEKGAFTHWTVDQKVMLVRSLEELGFIEMTSETEALTAGGMDAESVGKSADDLIAAYTGKPASEANFLTIMQAAMGPFEGWTYAEKAWYSQLMREVGLEGEGIT